MMNKKNQKVKRNMMKRRQSHEKTLDA